MVEAKVISHQYVLQWYQGNDLPDHKGEFQVLDIGP